MAMEAKTPDDVRAELLKQTQLAADAKNKTLTGKGTRVKVGQTRGKNPQVITWLAFDESQPDTLPTSSKEFVSLTNTPDEATLVGYQIAGYNLSQYTAASDPVKEFVDPAWDDDTEKQFRFSVRNYANGAECSIEDAAALIKPGFSKAFDKRKAAEAASIVPPTA